MLVNSMICIFEPLKLVGYKWKTILAHLGNMGGLLACDAKDKMWHNSAAWCPILMSDGWFESCVHRLHVVGVIWGPTIPVVDRKNKFLHLDTICNPKSTGKPIFPCSVMNALWRRDGTYILLWFLSMVSFVSLKHWNWLATSEKPSWHTLATSVVC